MSLYIQYHNVEKRGLKYLFSNDGQCAISTRRPHVTSAQGTVFLIVGVGQPRQFFLWEVFDIEGVDEDDDGGYIAYGSGWQLHPPQALDGPDFQAFKESCANFVSFRNIDDLSYARTLKKLAAKHRAKCSKQMTQAFLVNLLGMLKPGTADYRLVSLELTNLGVKPTTGVPRKIKPLVASAQNGKATKNLRALSIRQPHAEAIMRGIKKIEYRSIRTNIRGRVQIYASLGRFTKEEDAEDMKLYKIRDISCDDLPRGVLIGTVEISDCTEHDGEFHWHLRKPERAGQMLKPKKQPQPVWFNPF